MPQPIEQICSQDPIWQQLCQKLEATVSLPALVLMAWQMGLFIARAIVEQQLDERAQVQEQWSCCSVCGTRLVSKGFVKRQILTLVGSVEWKRRVGRCPRHCPGSYHIPLDENQGIRPYQQTSSELIRLGCLLAVFLPFGLAAWMLRQLCGIAVSEDTIWNWVQAAGKQAIEQLKIYNCSS